MTGDIQELKPRPTLFRPTSVSVAAFFLSLLAFWFSTAVVDFSGAPHLGGFHTGGWFYLGAPFVIGFSLCAALLFAKLARRTGEMAALTLAVLVFGLMMASSITSKLPSSRLPRIVGSTVAAVAQLHRFCVRDSFNDGSTIEGILGLSQLQFDVIVHEQNLKPSEERTPLTRFDNLGALALPATGTIWSNDHTEMYFDAKLNWLYFSHFSRIRR